MREANDSTASDRSPPLWAAVLLTAMAGGMGWGIRGQYGHQTGAMIAGVLVGFTLALLFLPWATSLAAARAIALCALGVSFGGSMTYGQTIGLTQDAELIGNWNALGWGMLGLAIKGGTWIGFCGLLLGMGLGGRRYRIGEVVVLSAIWIGLLYVGQYLLNHPFNPATKQLPRIYFSATWDWFPNNPDPKPRREVWGALIVALFGGVLFAWLYAKDILARNLALWGFLGGAIGFPLGQCLQAGHAWNVAAFRSGWLANVDPLINWWNMMEITFGATFGAVLALGVWLNRRRIARFDEPAVSPMPLPVEILLLIAHVGLLVVWQFFPMREFARQNVLGAPAIDYFRQVARFSVFGIPMMIFALPAIVAGRWFSYLFVLPIVALPIAGKTLNRMVYENASIAPSAGWQWYLYLPMGALTAIALVLASLPDGPGKSRRFARIGLLTSTWFYFAINFAFFDFPYPWLPWTGRTPSGLIFTVCALGLTAAALAPSCLLSAAERVSD